MPAKKQVDLKDYEANLIPEAIKETMRELNISYIEAVKLLTEMSYRLDHPKKKLHTSSSK